MKIFILAPKENWILDRLAHEYYINHIDQIVSSPDEADVIWLLSDWCWDQIPKKILKQKKVLTTIQHIVPSKFNLQAKRDFFVRDDYTDLYHVPCKITKEQIEDLTDKPIIVAPHWVNQHLWYPDPNIDTDELRNKYDIPNNSFIIGSFQRDTEGSDLKTPKLEKGPDIFCDAVEQYQMKYGDVFVVLAGWRRQYVMKRLSSAGIKFKYIELPEYSVLKELYHCLDLYIVGSRYEGGPMSIVECAAMNVPIISRNVGLAQTILHNDSIGDDLVNLTPNVAHAAKKVSNYYMPRGFKKFEEMFKMLDQQL